MTKTPRSMEAQSLVQRFRQDTLKHFPPGVRRTILRAMYTGKRLYGLSKWLLPSIGRTVVSGQERRLLVVYDLGSQSLSIGDILYFHEASLVLLEKHKVGKVDFALVYDPANPLGSRNPIKGTVPDQEFSYHLTPLLPLLHFHPQVGAIFAFDSHVRLERFVSDNADFYDVWPDATTYAGREYSLYSIVNDVLYDHYREHGRLPRLSARQHLVEWAESFYAEHAAGQVPISVHLRNNPNHHRDRNSNVDAWLEFFRIASRAYPAKFVIVGSASEIDGRFRACDNVVIAKDHHTSIEQDLALVQSAAMYFGAGSGPSAMAIFGDKPYLATNCATLIPHLFRDMTQEGDFVRMYFATPLQRFGLGKETVDLLADEFARMWKGIDRERWTSVRPTAASAPQLTSWLR